MDGGGHGLRHRNGRDREGPRRRPWCGSAMTGTPETSSARVMRVGRGRGPRMRYSIPMPCARLLPASAERGGEHLIRLGPGVAADGNVDRLPLLRGGEAEGELFAPT